MKVTIAIVSIFIGIASSYLYIPSERNLCEEEFGKPKTHLRSDERVMLMNMRSEKCTGGVFVGLFFGSLSYIALINLAKSRGWK